MSLEIVLPDGKPAFEWIFERAIQKVSPKRVAPSAAVEIRSPDDRENVLAEKVSVYVAAGTDVVMVVDPSARSVCAIDAAGSREFASSDIVTHPALPGFSLALKTLFATID